MILDSIIKYMMGLYTFLKKKMLVSNVLWVCLVALFVGLSIEAKAVIPNYIVGTNTNGNSPDTTYLQSTDHTGCFKMTKPADNVAWKYQNTNSVFTADGESIVTLENKYSPYSGNPQGTGYYYYNGSQWNYSTDVSNCENSVDPNGGGGGSSTWSVDISGCVFPSITAGNALDLSSVTGVVVKKDGTTQSSGFAGEWKLCDGSDLPSNTNAQTYSVKYVLTSGGTAESGCRDIEVSAGGTSAPTITNVPTPSAQCAANQINISTPSVDYHGSSANGSCWQYNNNNQWYDITSSTRLSVGTHQVRYIARNSNGQTTTSDQRTLTINDKPTINTSTISTPSAGSTLASVSILVSENGSTVTNRVWKRDGNTVDANNLIFQAGQTYNLTYEVTNGCGTSSQNYSVTIPSNGGQSPTINTSTLSVSPGMKLSEIQIDVDLHGCTEVSHRWRVDGNYENDDYVFIANHTYTLYYEITSSCGTSSRTYNNVITGSGSGSGSSSYHIRCTSGEYGNNGGTIIDLNETSDCYYTELTTPLLYSDWQLEDANNNVISTTTEFSFNIWNNQNQLYSNSSAVSHSPLQHCGWDRTNSYTSNCTSYSGPYFTLFIYQKNGVWYASETCDGVIPVILSITPNTAQKVDCDNITFLASESSSSIEWYYGTTLLSNGDGITINGNRLTISPSYVYTNDNADVYAKNGDVESNKVAVSKSEIVLRTNSNENVTLTRYTNNQCPDMCAYKFDFNQIYNFWTQWWFEKDGEKLSIAVAPDCHSDIKLESNGNFKEIDRKSVV